jgi:hypothetical protein
MEEAKEMVEVQTKTNVANNLHTIPVERNVWDDCPLR